MWNHDNILQFLELYKNESCLWDPSNVGYKDRGKVYEAWKHIHQVMDIPIDELKRKKESLLASFRAILNKKRMSAASGTKKEFKPQWFAWNLMESFLTNKDTEKLNSTISPNTIYQTQRVQKFGIRKGKKKKEAIEEKRSPSPTIIKGDNEIPLKATVVTESAGRDVICPFQANSESDDECELYGRLLAKKLRRLKSEKRELVMYQIDGIFIHYYRNHDHLATMKSEKEGDSRQKCDTVVSPINEADESDE